MRTEKYLRLHIVQYLHFTIKETVKEAEPELKDVQADEKADTLEIDDLKVDDIELDDLEIDMIQLDTDEEGESK